MKGGAIAQGENAGKSNDAQGVPADSDTLNTISRKGAKAQRKQDGSAAASPPPAKPVRGLAQLRGVPDLDAMCHLARMDKTAWKAKGHSLRPQHLHRFSRARAAA